MKSIINKAILSGVTLCSGLAIHAETIGWWHFDEQNPGGKTTGSPSEIVNAVSADYGAGKVFSADNTGAIGTDSTYYPVYTAVPSDANRVLSIYDPVTGHTHTNRASLTFVKDGTASANNGGGVDIPNEEQFRISTYTVELFFRTTDTAFDTIAPIVGKVYTSFGAGSESWQIGLLTNGKLFLRYSGSSSSTSGGNAVVNDGVWHHLALVCSYDGTDSRFKLYVDGVIDIEKTKSGATKQSTSFGDIYLGAYGLPGRKLAGTVDELRISNVALEPEQFLRVAEPDCPQVVTDDTLVWMSMDGAANASLADCALEYVKSSTSCANWNETTNATIEAALVRKNATGTATFAADVVKPCVHIGNNKKDKETVCTNSASCLLAPEGTTSGYLFQLSEYNYCSASFTTEMFFRVPQDGGTDARTLLKSNGHFQLTLNSGDTSGKIRLVYWTAEKGWTDGGRIGEGLVDGCWHHVALVYDKLNATLGVYLDAVEQKTIQNINLADGAAACFVGGSHDKTQLFNGNIDSVRITKGALPPDSFLYGCDAPPPPGFVLIIR